MDKIQIKGLIQGKKKLKDGGFAIGFRTKYGVVWTTMQTFPRLFQQNPVLEKLFKPYTGVIKEEDFIGRYINVRAKRRLFTQDGVIAFGPRL